MFRLDRVMPDRGEEADEEPPVERGVVDDEDATAGHDASPATGATSRRTVAASASLSASGRIGLEM